MENLALFDRKVAGIGSNAKLDQGVTKLLRIDDGTVAGGPLTPRERRDYFQNTQQLTRTATPSGATRPGNSVGPFLKISIGAAASYRTVLM
jgi:hypothetical protein